MKRHFGWLAVLAVATGCGPAGSIKGKVTVEGGSGAQVPVAVYGPASQVVLTGDDGSFTASGLPDGQYLTRAVIKGAEVEEVSAAVKVSGGKGDSEPTLAFKLKAMVTPGKITGRVAAMGGSPANVTVFVHGPQSSVAVTAMDGSFTTGELPDGTYVLRAVMKGALVEEQTAQAKLTLGKLDAEAVLTFRFPETATVSGKVVFSDASDATGLVVTLTTSTWMATRTGAMGAFSFANVPAGAAVLSVEAPNTREGRVSLGVQVMGTMVDAGELRLTPVARFGGVVTNGGMAVSGASVAGTSLAATTDATGRYDFEGAPVGNVTVVARSTSPSAVGTASQRLVRGANTDVAISVTSDAKTGTVTGSVTFAGPQSPRIITVSIPSLGLTTTVGNNGAYTLGSVPVGEWDVVATAPYHPRQLLGRVRVSDQGTSTLAGQVLSFFEPIWEAPVPLNSLVLRTSSPPWTLLGVQDGSAQRFLVVNSRTRDARTVFVGADVFTPRFSTSGRYLGFVASGLLHVYDLTTGQFRIWTNDSGMSNFAFSTDDSTLFVARTTALERYELSSGMMTRFPSTGSGTVFVQTNDRWFVREGANYTLVEPAAATPNVFTNVSFFFLVPIPLALTDCTAAGCTLRVMPVNGRTASTVTGTWPTNTSFGAGPDYIIVFNLTVPYIVRVSDGALFSLPAGASNFVFSPNNQRVAYVVATPGNGALREEALPPSPTTSPIAQTTGTFSASYLSNTRLVAFDSSPTRRIIDVRNGTAGTPDSDVTTFFFNSPAAFWATSSPSMWRAFVADRVAAFDIPTTVTAVTFARAGAPATEVGIATFDATSLLVLDGRNNQTRRVYGYRPLGAGLRINTLETFVVVRQGYPALLVVDNTTDQAIETFEARMLLTTPVEATATYFNIDETRRRLVMGALR